MNWINEQLDRFPSPKKQRDVNYCGVWGVSGRCRWQRYCDSCDTASLEVPTKIRVKFHNICLKHLLVAIVGPFNKKNALDEGVFYKYFENWELKRNLADTFEPHYFTIRAIWESEMRDKFLILKPPSKHFKVEKLCRKLSCLSRLVKRR